MDLGEEMGSLEEQLCPWKLSKEIVALGGNRSSYFKWVHPWSSVMYKENKRKYVICEWFQVARRNTYPAYSIVEILSHIPNYILGHDNLDVSDAWSDINYYHDPVEACAHCYIKILKEIDQERKEEEEEIARFTEDE